MLGLQVSVQVRIVQDHVLLRNRQRVLEQRSGSNLRSPSATAWD